MKSYFKKKWHMVVLLAIVFAGGISIGFMFHFHSSEPAVSSVREYSDEYTFINPLLFTTSQREHSFSEYKSLEESISTFITQGTIKDTVSDVSVYVRDLNSGKWMSMYPDKTYAPSSMLKVVTLITVLRAAESDPSLLAESIAIKGDASILFQDDTRYPPIIKFKADRYIPYKNL